MNLYKLEEILRGTRTQKMLIESPAMAYKSTPAIGMGWGKTVGSEMLARQGDENEVIGKR